MRIAFSIFGFELVALEIDLPFLVCEDDETPELRLGFQSKKEDS